MADKVKSAVEVVRTIPDGSCIALGGFAIARNPITIVHELIRQQKKNLTLWLSQAGSRRPSAVRRASHVGLSLLRLRRGAPLYVDHAKRPDRVATRANVPRPPV